MLNCQRDLFDLDDEMAYLNGAYMSPQLKSVTKAGIQALKLKSGPYTISPADFFSTGEALRKVFSQLIDNLEPERTVLIPSVSYGMANIALNLPKGKGNIVIAGEQFPSNVYPWMRACQDKGLQLKIASPPATIADRGGQWNEKILESIDAQTALVAIGHVHWADGTLFDLKAIREKCWQCESLLVIDGTQSVGALPLSVSEFQPDALICAGYKWLLGPYGLGMAYYGPYFDHGRPIEENWINRKGSEDFSQLINYQTDYQPGALRYEVGEHSQFILAPMLLASIGQLLQWGPENVQAYCKQLVHQPKERLRELGFSLQNESQAASHLFGVHLPTTFDIPQLQSALQQNKVNVSIRGQSLRVSPNVYNTSEEVWRLVEVLVGFA